jgi:hypothetical protein
MRYFRDWGIQFEGLTCTQAASQTMSVCTRERKTVYLLINPHSLHARATNGKQSTALKTQTSPAQEGRHHYCPASLLLLPATAPCTPRCCCCIPHPRCARTRTCMSQNHRSLSLRALSSCQENTARQLRHRRQTEHDNQDLRHKTFTTDSRQARTQDCEARQPRPGGQAPSTGQPVSFFACRCTPSCCCCCSPSPRWQIEPFGNPK